MLQDFFEYIDKDIYNRTLYDFRRGYLQMLLDNYTSTNDQKYVKLKDDFKEYTIDDLHRLLKDNGFKIIGCGCNKRNNIVVRRIYE